MEYKAKSISVRISPRKVREVSVTTKKLGVAEAIEKLTFSTKNGAREILKTLNSAIANSKLSAEKLKIKNILVDEGMKMKRRDKSHGNRFGGGMILKKSSNITVILEETGNQTLRTATQSQSHGK